MISHSTPDHCPHCGKKVTLSTGISHDEHLEPMPGAFTLCIRCAQLSVFGENLKLRLPTAEEKAEASTNKLIVEAQILLMAGMPRPK